jgi:hypothetical protein
MDYKDLTFKQLTEGKNYLYGYSLCTLPDQIYLEIKNKVDNFSSSKHTNIGGVLAGQIDEEYNFPIPNTFTNWLKGYVNIFHQRSNYLFKFKEAKSTPSNPNPQIGLTTEESWINYQYKHEYNPPHTHSGILSWVLWYQIPYLIENEKKYGPGKNKQDTSCNGVFSFQYNIGMGVASEPLFVDKTWEKTVVLFPADLSHNVYPFYTSEDPRITIAGNISLK